MYKQSLNGHLRSLDWTQQPRLLSSSPQKQFYTSHYDTLHKATEELCWPLHRNRMTFLLPRGQGFLPSSLSNYSLNPSLWAELLLLGYDLLWRRRECSCLERLTGSCRNGNRHSSREAAETLTADSPKHGILPVFRRALWQRFVRYGKPTKLKVKQRTFTNKP